LRAMRRWLWLIALPLLVGCGEDNDESAAECPWICSESDGSTCTCVNGTAPSTCHQTDASGPPACTDRFAVADACCLLDRSPPLALGDYHDCTCHLPGDPTSPSCEERQAENDSTRVDSCPPPCDRAGELQAPCRQEDRLSRRGLDPTGPSRHPVTRAPAQWDHVIGHERSGAAARVWR
jgi:hypothetical protein